MVGLYTSTSQSWPPKDLGVVESLVVVVIVILTTCAGLTNAHIEISFDEEFIWRKSFVDKSEFLVEFFRDVGRDFVTLPALFGKTTNLKMIEKFAQYQWKVDGDPMRWQETHAYQIFKHLKIAKHTDVVSKHMAQHPVISFDLNMENAGVGVFEQLLSRINSQLNHCFLEHQHKFETYYSSNGGGGGQSQIKDWVLKTLRTGMWRKELVTNLQYTVEAMNECFDANVILLMDGFDDFMYRNCEPIEKTFDLFQVMYSMLQNVFESSANGNVHVFISSASSMVFDHFQMYQYMQLHRFLEGDKYTPYFGFDGDELNNISDRYDSNVTERQHVLKYLDGYRIKGRSYYSPYSIHEFFHKRYFSKPRVPYKAFVRPKNPCKFIWKFLKHPKYLAAVAKMLKHVPVPRGGDQFKTRYEPGAFTLYIEYVSRDFNNTESFSPALLFTLSIEHGIFAPVARAAVAENTSKSTYYGVANYLMYTLLLRHLRLHFKLYHRIDIVEMGGYLNQMLHSIRQVEAKTDLEISLSKAITKLTVIAAADDYNEHWLTAKAVEFAYHSLLHAATYTNESLYMVEDYPSPVKYDAYNQYELDMDRRCVSLIRNRLTDTALLIKITCGKSAQVALQLANSYVYYDHEQRVNVQVKYVGINVERQNIVNILIGYVDELKTQTHAIAIKKQYAAAAYHAVAVGGR